MPDLKFNNLSTIRAKLINGVLYPINRFNLKFPSNTELTINILGISMPYKINKIKDAFMEAAGSWRGSVNAEKLKKNIYADRKIITRQKIKLCKKRLI